MSLKSLTLALSITLLFGACSDSGENESLLSTSSYELLDLKQTKYNVLKTGVDFKVEGLEDKVIIFDIFATWCPPCRAAAPNLSSLQKTYEDKVKVIGVLIEEEKTNAYVQRFVDTYGAEYSISNSEDNKALSRALASATGIGQGFPIPLMVMYYKGKYINHYIGVVPEEMVESDIKRALGK